MHGDFADNIIKENVHSFAANCYLDKIQMPLNIFCT